ncbi:MAG: cupin [Acidobacteriota bacterium]
MTSQGQLFANLPSALEDERFDDLLRRGSTRIERILSHGQSSPPDFWYDQGEGEWVLLVRGAARLELRDPDEVMELRPGDWIDISPHRRHRVAWTDPDQITLWLAVFYDAAAETPRQPVP